MDVRSSSRYRNIEGIRSQLEDQSLTDHDSMVDATDWLSRRSFIVN